ncbi:hypothetical protein LCM17_23100 [Cereibacter sphaeroides]|nr:hypothetical protein [Cereibacter sphaeroides]
MDLMKMSRDDLSTVRAGLEVVAKAADLLAKGGLDPVISLSDGETVLRAGAILGSLRGEPELVEPIEIVASPTTPVVEGTVGMAKVVEPTSAQVAREPLHATVPGDTVVCSGPSPTVAVDAQKLAEEPVTLRTGPFSHDERAAILAAHDAGASANEIAAAQRRGVAPIKLVLPKLLAAREKQNNGGSEPAPVPSPGSVRAKADPAATRTAPADECIGSPQGVSSEAATEKRAPGEKVRKTSGAVAAAKTAPTGAGPRKPVVTTHPSAAVTTSRPAARAEPPTAAPSQGADLPTARPGCPADLKGLGREIWFAIAALRTDPVFDAELDLELAEGLARGRPLAEISLDLGVDADAARKRFGRLSEFARNDRDVMTIDGQEALLDVLTRRMKISRGAAA